MELNLQTAVTVIVLLGLGITVLSVTVRWARRTHPGNGRWAIAGLLLVLSFVLLSLRSAPGWINVVSANTGIAMAAILYLEGAREFRGLTPTRWLAYAGGGVVIGTVAYFRYIVPNMNVRAAVMSAFLGIVLTLVSLRLLREIPPEHRFGQTLTGLLFALCAATLLARAAYCFFGPPMNNRNELAGLYGIFFMASVVEMAGFSTGLALLEDERVLADLKHTKERASLAGTEVARHIEAEALLRENEERLRVAQKAASIGTFDWNLGTGVNKWTPELEAIYGLRPGDFPGTQEAWESLVHPDDRARVVQLVTRSLESETPVAAEWRVIWPDGSVRWIGGRWQVIKSAAGEPLHVVGVNIDMTDQKNMENALRRSEERFRLAVKATNDAIWDYDLKTDTVSWDETFAAVYGKPTEISKPWEWWVDNIHDEDRERTISSLRELIGSGKSAWAGEYRFRRVDGEWAHIYDRAYIARDASGTAWRVIGAMQDLTDRKRAEGALRESEERFRRVFEEGPLGLALVGRDNRFFKVNTALCQMVGYSEEELVRKTFSDITHPDEVAADLELAERLFKREIPFYRMQKRYVKKNGEFMWINLTASPVADNNGEVLYGIAMVEDITEVKRTQEEALARQKLETVGTLARGIAHDFNNLLGGIRAQAELALEELDGGSSCKGELKAIEEVATRGAEIVQQLMIYSGQEGGAVELVDISREVEAMLALLKVSVSKHAVVKVDFDRNLPRTRASAAQLRQLVMNIVTNASDAIGDREGEIRVITRRVELSEGLTRWDSLPKNDYISLEVRDTGCGMSPETKAKVFDPFFTTKSMGRGLGLAVVSGIVRSLGGEIRLTSEVAKGTSFQVLLPIAESPDRTGSSETSTIAEVGGSRKASVLVVEDEEVLRNAVSRMLRRNGFEVFEASDGSSAIEILRANLGEIDLILLDMTIPGASSGQVLTEAANWQPDVRVVLTSAYSREMVSREMNAPQIKSFIRKPFRLADVVTTLRQVLVS